MFNQKRHKENKLTSELFQQVSAVNHLYPTSRCHFDTFLLPPKYYSATSSQQPSPNGSWLPQQDSRPNITTKLIKNKWKRKIQFRRSSHSPQRSHLITYPQRVCCVTFCNQITRIATEAQITAVIRQVLEITRKTLYCLECVSSWRSNKKTIEIP